MPEYIHHVKVHVLRTYRSHSLESLNRSHSIHHVKVHVLSTFEESVSCLVHLHVAGVRHELDHAAQEKLERGLLLLRVLFRPLRLARHPTQHLQARLQGQVSSSK